MSKINFGFFGENFKTNYETNMTMDDGLSKTKIGNDEITTKTKPKLKREAIVMRLVKETLYNSAAQALLKIYETPSKIVKLFWCVCLLGACSLCAYFVVESLVLFFSYEVSTKTRTYTETSSLFPKVTICNKNVFTTKYAFDFANGLKYDEVLWRINTKLNVTQREKLTHSFEDTLLACSFNAEACEAREDFTFEYDKSLGACYTFNDAVRNTSSGNGRLRESIRAGLDYGLTLVIYSHFYDRLSKDFNLYSGLIIKIGNSSYATTSFGIEVASGFNTNILVERYFERTLPRPYSNCDISNDQSDNDGDEEDVVTTSEKGKEDNIYGFFVLSCYIFSLNSLYCINIKV